MQPQAAIRKGARFRISEIYESIQGEGLLTGTPSVFLRTSGCNLRCWFCDTPFASWAPEGDYLESDEVMSRLREFKASHIVLTGGEPMIFREVGTLCKKIRAEGYHLTIETAGTIFRELECDLMSLSPKLHSSAPPSSAGSWVEQHHRRRERFDVVEQLMQHPYQLKFVVDQPSDAAEVLEYLKRLTKVDRSRVLLMPQGIDEATLARQAEWLIPWCQENDVRFCSRAHIHWFGNRRGT